MGLSNELSCESGRVSCHLNPHRFFQSEVLRLYFPMLEPWVAQSVSLPSCSSWFIHMQMWDHPVHQPPYYCDSSPPRLPISAPPTGLNECFFFNSLVGKLPYSSISWPFWLGVFLFIFKCVVFLFVVKRGTVYLAMPPSWLEVPTYNLLF